MEPVAESADSTYRVRAADRTACQQAVDRAVFMRAWSMQRRAAGVEMRLRAVSMRLFARAMRGDRRHPPAAPAPGAAPASPLPGLQRAIVLEQAKGVIAECLDCSVDEAGVLLTEHSRRLNQPPDAFACEILNNRGAELRPHKAP